MFFRIKMAVAVAAMFCILVPPAVAQTATVYSLPGSPADYEITYNGPTGVSFRHKSTGALYGYPPGVFRFATNVWKAEGKVLVPQFAMPSAPSPADIAAAEVRGYARGVQAAVDAVGKLR